jgi:hypothetical protein
VNLVFPRLLLRVSGLWTALAILVALVGTLSAVARLLTWFSFWDDEGYMLVSLAHYINEGHLYTRTSSYYGPFYFYAQGIFFQLLRLPVTHDMGRLVTLVYWVASSLLATVFVYRLSKSPFLACAAGLCNTLAGSVLANEPGHPQQVVLLLYMIAACLSQPSLSGKYYLRLFLLGCVGAALAFTKVNVGVFYIAGLTQALVCLLPSGRTRSIGIVLMLIYAAASPWLVMHAGLDHGFRAYFFLATVGGIVTFACGALIQAHHRFSMRAAFCAGAGLVTGTALIIVGTSLQGMSIGSLARGVILNALHHPDVFYVPLGVTPLNLLGALILTAGVVSLRWWGRRPAVSWSLHLLRCSVGIGSIWLLTLDHRFQLLTFYHRIQWVMPLLPLTLIPGSHWERDAVALFPRFFITYMAVTQFLEPYPVAGSQTGIAAAPMILWAFICIADGIAGLRAASYRLPQGSGEGLRLDAVIGGTILVVYAGVSVVGIARSSFPPATTGLRGSAWLHLPPDQAIRFESLVRNVSTNCSILFTMPGMGSFNIWSGVPTPNGWNLTAWMKGINPEGQAEILKIIVSDSQACAIVNRRIGRFWDKDETGMEAALPLAPTACNTRPGTMATLTRNAIGLVIGKGWNKDPDGNLYYCAFGARSTAALMLKCAPSAYFLCGSPCALAQYPH